MPDSLRHNDRLAGLNRNLHGAVIKLQGDPKSSRDQVENLVRIEMAFAAVSSAIVLSTLAQRIPSTAGFQTIVSANLVTLLKSLGRNSADPRERE